MRPPAAILFDVFGTLVTYEADRVRLTYPATHRLAVALGYAGDHDDLVEAWDAASAELELAASTSLREFSMTDAAQVFAARCQLALGPDDAAALGSTFVQEWQRHVVPVPGAAPMLRRLGRRHRLGIVSNTHDPAMVPALLAAMGVADVFDVVVLSVEHGWCKPHPSIYQAALDALAVSPEEAWFVGDSFEADYRAPSEEGMRALLIGADASLPVAPSDRIVDVTELERVLAETL